MPSSARPLSRRGLFRWISVLIITFSAVTLALLSVNKVTQSRSTPDASAIFGDWQGQTNDFDYSSGPDGIWYGARALDAFKPLPANETAYTPAYQRATRVARLLRSDLPWGEAPSTHLAISTQTYSLRPTPPEDPVTLPFIGLTPSLRPGRVEVIPQPLSEWQEDDLRVSAPSLAALMLDPVQQARDRLAYERRTGAQEERKNVWAMLTTDVSEGWVAGPDGGEGPSADGAILVVATLGADEDDELTDLSAWSVGMKLLEQYTGPDAPPQAFARPIVFLFAEDTIGVERFLDMYRAEQVGADRRDFRSNNYFTTPPPPIISALYIEPHTDFFPTEIIGPVVLRSLPSSSPPSQRSNTLLTLLSSLLPLSPLSLDPIILLPFPAYPPPTTVQNLLSLLFSPSPPTSSETNPPSVLIRLNPYHLTTRARVEYLRAQNDPEAEAYQAVYESREEAEGERVVFVDWVLQVLAGGRGALMDLVADGSQWAMAPSAGWREVGLAVMGGLGWTGFGWVSMSRASRSASAGSGHSKGWWALGLPLVAALGLFQNELPIPSPLLAALGLNFLTPLVILREHLPTPATVFSSACFALAILTPLCAVSLVEPERIVKFAAVELIALGSGLVAIG